MSAQTPTPPSGSDGGGQSPAAQPSDADSRNRSAASGSDLTTPNPSAQGSDRWSTAFRDIVGGSFVLSILAVVLGLVAGAILIAITDARVEATSAYFFSRPTDMLGAIWDAVSGGYLSLFNGSIYNTGATSFSRAIRPITDTLTAATPLIAGGLGVGLGFRVGLFNIGGQGQMIIGAIFAGWLGFALHLPVGIHLAVAVLGGLLGGAIWAGVAGLLKARTGAHEVILTIMLNYIAVYLLLYLLRTPGLLQEPGSNNPKTPAVQGTAVLPKILGPSFSLTLGFILVIVATIFTWWLLSRSNLGFQFRAVGENPNAARVAGINVSRMYVYSMLISGALLGLAAVSQVLGNFTEGFSTGVDAGIGFDAITVALLGRSKPWGIFIAGLLFGALKSGSYLMQAANDIPIDIVLVVQSLIVLFIAAPPLVRAIFRLPTPGVHRAKEVKAS